MKKLLLLLSFAWLTVIANAQWQQTSLDSTSVKTLDVIGNKIFAGIGSFSMVKNGDVYVSSNNGNNWTALNKGFPANAEVNAIAISGNNVFAGTVGFPGFDGGMYLSPNNGSSWATLNLGITNFAVWSLAVSGNKIFAGTSKGMYFSTNNGGSWVAVNKGLTDSSSVSALTISGNNIFAGTMNGRVFLSANNGSSWSDISSDLPNNSNVMLTVSGKNILAATNRGVYLTSDNGSSWKTVITRLSTDINFTAFDITDSCIFAGAGRNGVYWYSKKGDSWHEEKIGLTNTFILSLAICSSYIFAGTEDDGVWKLPLSQLGLKK